MKMDVWERYSTTKMSKKKSNEPMQNVFLVKKTLAYRVLYFLGAIAYFSGCLYQTLAFLKIYFKYPTTMEVNVKQAPVLKFPAVTVCNGNRVRQSMWCNLDKSICEKNEGESDDIYVTRMMEAYKYLNRSIRITMGHTREDLIRSCQFEERICDGLIGQYFNYEYTNCYTINARWANASAIPLNASMFRPRSGRSSELSIMLNLESHEYSPMNPVVRARMTIHDPETIPNPQYDGVSLQPGRTYNYGIRESTIHVLPEPYQTNCKNYTGLKERRTGAKQTQEDCMSQCCAEYHVKYCDCTVHRLSLIYDIRTCWKQKEKNCLKEHDQEVKELCYPECRMPCTKITYTYLAVDSYALQQGACEDVDMFNRTLSDEDKSKLICLRVYYATADSEIYTHRPKYNGIQVFSVIGGYIGLWLGVSLLDIHGYFVNGAFLCFQKKKASKESHKRNSVQNIQNKISNHRY